MFKPIEVNKQNFKAEVLEATLPVMVDFWATWCGPCQMMAPILDELATELEGKLKIVKLNTDLPENQDLTMEFDIKSIPNLKIFKNGVVVKTLVGYRLKDVLLGELKELV